MSSSWDERTASLGEDRGASSCAITSLNADVEATSGAQVHTHSTRSREKSHVVGNGYATSDGFSSVFFFCFLMSPINFLEAEFTKGRKPVGERGKAYVYGC